MIKKLASCVGEYKKYAVGAPVSVTFEVILEILLPLLMARIIDVGIANSDMSYVLKIGGLMVVMVLFSMLFGALSGRFAAVAGAGFAKNLRRKLFYKLQDFSFANIDKFSTASMITRMTTDVNFVQMAFMMIIRLLVRAPIMLVSATFMTFTINSRLALIFLVAVPFLAIGLGLMASKAFPRFMSMLKKYDGLNAFIQENLIAIRVVKSFVRGDYEKQRFEASAADLQRAQKRAEKLLVLANPLMQFSMYACMIAVSWFGGRLIIGGHLEAGEFFSFIGYIGQILTSLMMISMSFVMITMSRASAARIVEVIDEIPDISDENADRGLKVADGSVVFDNVGFSYSKDKGNLTLSDISLKIDSGETVGIIGGTGVGKSSLVQLIPRLYDATVGRVLVAGHDVREYDTDELRNNVAMVLQKNVLFSGTIMENLKWGNENADDEQIVAACKAACAHDFIESFPDGYQTDLGQGGVNLSGGQKQRLCIARALLKNPKIIILDDSTSAVDTHTDSQIRSAFKESFGNTTAIIIAQRIASVMDADKIVVMNDGRIDAVGTHEQLLASNDIYREVYESQQKGAM
ncbi:MAG: ABC transporter ATP-binding protein [Clostridia bacterium]|nr:ABC transporter ATP-binding protein [Clostridia bacterium]